MRPAKFVRFNNQASRPFFIGNDSLDAVNDKVSITYDVGFVYVKFSGRHEDKPTVVIPMTSIDYLLSDDISDKPAAKK